MRRDGGQSWRSKLVTENRRPAHTTYRGEGKEIPIIHLSSLSGHPCYFKNAGRAFLPLGSSSNFLPGRSSCSGRNCRAHKGQCVTNAAVSSCLAGNPQVLRMSSVSFTAAL